MENDTNQNRFIEEEIELRQQNLSEEEIKYQGMVDGRDTKSILGKDGLLIWYK